MIPLTSSVNDDSAWYERWFNADYLLVYPHRDQGEADRQVASVLERVAHPCMECLDLGCGSGRHARALASAGKSVTAIDLSFDLLRAATSGSDTTAAFVRSDIRYLPFRDRSFDLLTSFFTSFGYFAHDTEHLEALREWGRVLRLRGSLVIDLPDREATIAELVEQSERVLSDGRTLSERRSLSSDGRRIEKSIVLESSTGKRSYEESVRLFTESEILSLLNDAGFQNAKRVGNLDGYTKRMVILSENEKV